MRSAGNIVALIDLMISKPCFEMEIFRCIHVSLLCVQEFGWDRPTVSIVISMLKSDIVDLPRPMQPAFTERQIALDIEPSQPWFSDPDRLLNRKRERFKGFEVEPRSNRGQTVMTS